MADQQIHAIQTDHTTPGLSVASLTDEMHETSRHQTTTASLLS
jgi:hypothetical protein